MCAYICIYMYIYVHLIELPPPVKAGNWVLLTSRCWIAAIVGHQAHIWAQPQRGYQSRGKGSEKVYPVQFCREITES